MNSRPESRYAQIKANLRLRGALRETVLGPHRCRRLLRDSLRGVEWAGTVDDQDHARPPSAGERLIGRSKRYPVPDGFPSGVCYKYCIGVCHRENCSRKHEKTAEAMQIIRDAETTKEN